MKLEQLLRVVGENPIFKSEILRIGKSSTNLVNVEISRWLKAGRIIKLKRGIYMVNLPYIKPFSNYDLYIANILYKPSYISMEKALEYYGIIPEKVCVYTSLTTKRPTTFKNPVGIYSYRHIKPSLFFGYQIIKFDIVEIFMASIEKAILDIFYLNDILVDDKYLDEFRLQNLEVFDIDKLIFFAKRFDCKKMIKSTNILVEYIKKHKRKIKYI